MLEEAAAARVVYWQQSDADINHYTMTQPRTRSHLCCKITQPRVCLIHFLSSVTWQDDVSPVGGFSLRGCLVSSLDDNGVPSGESVQSAAPVASGALNIHPSSNGQRDRDNKNKKSLAFYYYYYYSSSNNNNNEESLSSHRHHTIVWWCHHCYYYWCY